MQKILSKVLSKNQISMALSTKRLKSKFLEEYYFMEPQEMARVLWATVLKTNFQ